MGHGAHRLAPFDRTDYYAARTSRQEVVSLGERICGSCTHISTSPPGAIAHVEAGRARSAPVLDDLQAAWEGVAADVLGETGCDDPPVDAFELADCLGLEVRRSPDHDGHLVGDVVYVPMAARRVRRHGVCAHEMAHWCLDRAAEDNTEDAARYLSGALMLPRRPFDRDLCETAWDLRLLQQRHINASAEMIARRVVTMRDAVATVIDNGRVKARDASPWLHERFRRLSRWERELADEVLESGETVRGDELVWAFPVFHGCWRRVVLVAEAEQLALRF